MSDLHTLNVYACMLQFIWGAKFSPYSLKVITEHRDYRLKLRNASLVTSFTMSSNDNELNK